MTYMRTIGYVFLAVLFLSTVPYAADAANIKIQPHQLKPVDPSSPYNYQEPAHIWGDGGEADYYAVVNLPVGKTITRLTFHHRSMSAADNSGVYLYRTKFGQEPEIIASISSGANTFDAVVPVSTTTILRPLVKTGYTYYVSVEVGAGYYVHGVIVRYE